MIMNTKKRIEKPYKKVLKSCTRCRQHKTKCDAAVRKPLLCTLCAKKQMACIFEIIDTPPKRSADVIEQLSSEVSYLKGSLGGMLVRRSRMLREMMQRSGMKEDEHKELDELEVLDEEEEFELEELEHFEEQLEEEDFEEEDDSEEEEEQLEEEQLEEEQLEHHKEFKELKEVNDEQLKQLDQIPSTAPAVTHLSLPASSSSSHTPSAFTLGALALTRPQASQLFATYNANFHKHIPILPDQFLYDIDQVYHESDLLFWSICVVSLMETSVHAQLALSFGFLELVGAVKLLVVTKCWYNTPRSVHTLLSLSILTTWPLPTAPGFETGSTADSGDVSMKYLALMEDLSLQLGLHKSEFINEFSHKTHVGISKYSSDNNKVIRERIYKYVSIQSNFWLTYLGYPQQKQDDYILDHAAKILTPPSPSAGTTPSSFGSASGASTTRATSKDEAFINTTLKLSSIQSKIAKIFESADSSITGLYQINKTKRFLNIGMFEVILQELSKLTGNTPIYQLTIEYTKLQLYLYAFPPLDRFKTDLNLSRHEYKQYVYKALSCCFCIIKIFSREFVGREILAVPIHYRFALELSLMVIMKVYYSALLGNVEEYEYLKSQFQKGYSALTNSHASVSVSDIEKVLRVLRKYQAIYVNNKQELLNRGINGDKYYLLQNTSHSAVSFSVSVLYNEMNEMQPKPSKVSQHLVCFDWKAFGLNKDIPQQNDIIEYLEREHSLL